MPPVLAAVAPAVIGAGATLYASGQSRRAANNANAAQQAAAAQQLAEQRAVRDQALQLQNPFIQGGYGAFDELLREYGVQPPQGQGGQAPPQAPQGPRLDGQRYFEDNDDVEANYRRILETEGPDSPSLGGARTPAEYAQVHYTAYGQTEGRGAPMLPQQGAEPTKVPSDVGPRPDAPQRPADLAPPTFSRPQDLAVPQFQRPADMGAPTFQFNPKDWINEAGVQYRIEQGGNVVNNASAARGKLRSGDAAAALLRMGQGEASAEYGNAFNRALAGFDRAQQNYQFGQQRLDNIFNADRSYGSNLWLTQQGREDEITRDKRSFDGNLWQYNTDRGDRNYLTDQNVFGRDRAFGADRADARVNNLFRLATAGQNAAGAVTNAGQTFANNAGNIYGSQADAAAQAAYARANANNQIAGGLASAAGNIFSAYNWGGANRGGAPMQTADWSRGAGGIVPGSGSPFNPGLGFNPFRPPVF